MATSIKQLASSTTEKQTIFGFLDFLIKDFALGDTNDQVRATMLEAGLILIKNHGKQHISELLAIMETNIIVKGNSDRDDNVRQSIAILTGSLAQHFEQNDPRIEKVINQLLQIIETPSESVQISVSECLMPLIQLSPTKAGPLLNKCFEMLFTNESYGCRRGAAYAISGITRGYGYESLDKFKVMETLKEAAQDKKSTMKREGAMFVYQSLSNKFGPLFEPCVIQILSILLVAYGDTSKNVRVATDATCKSIMSRLSGHCVKHLLPSLLHGLDSDDSWKTKVG